MDSKLIGSVLLIVGTSIGAGMLALPIATASLGFFGSVILLILCWIVMTAGAFLFLEANLWFPQNSNIISIAGATIGPFGQIIAWLSYLLLLYSLLCAYIAGGSDLFHNLLAAGNIHIPISAAAVGFTLIFGCIVYRGIRTIDYTNRALMFIKFSAFFVLVLLLTPYISFDNLNDGSIAKITSATAVMVTITSFGYAPIVPSLRIYFAGDVAKLKKAILIGSLIPLICYIAWDAAIMGIIPLHGDHGLLAILNSTNSTSGLVNELTKLASHETVSVFAKLFTSICVLTSFLGVSLILSDFLADGLQLEKQGKNNLFIHLIAFLPPLIIVLFSPNAFVYALEYAGIYCIVLLVLLPAWIVWHGRYHKHIQEGFRVVGGKKLLAFLIILSLIGIAYGFAAKVF